MSSSTPTATKRNKAPGRALGILVGLAISVAAHALFLFGFNERKDKPKIVAEDAPAIRIEMPEYKPEQEPAKVEDQPTDDEPQNSFAPPTLVEIPNVIPNASFVQVVEPPPPPNLAISKGLVSIPAAIPSGGTGGIKLFELSQLDEVPTPKFQASPIYPPAMLRGRVAGEVLIRFVVNTSGNVVDAMVEEASRTEFIQPALQAVRQWKFRPGRIKGRFVNTRMTVPVGFELKD